MPAVTVLRDAMTGSKIVVLETGDMSQLITTVFSWMAKSLQVSSFDLVEMKNKSDFFDFVGQWQAHVDLMLMHLIAFFMMMAFTLVHTNVTPPTQGDMEDHQC